MSLPSQHSTVSFVSPVIWSPFEFDFHVHIPQRYNSDSKFQTREREREGQEEQIPDFSSPPPPLFSLCCNFAMPDSPPDNDESSTTILDPELEPRPASAKCLTLRALLAASSSAEDLRLENDTEYQSSPRGVLEGYRNGIGSEANSPFQERRSLFTMTGKPLSHWRKLVHQWKQKSLKHLNTFPRITRKWSKREQCNDHDHDEDLQFSVEANLCYFKASWKIFSFPQLKSATNGFSEGNLIGKGGFAKVYKGCLPDGQLIAVKRLIKGTHNEQNSSFFSELGVLVHVEHHNIAKLIGYGIERGIHLVFQLSSLGSLGSILRGSREHLDWPTRYNIALGIAEGLVYLHDNCEKRLIHRDIKSDNILLSENYQPQISDFGLALWLPRQQTHHTVMDHEGTFGYIAPEYLMQGLVDEKTDVFAFGVVLLELITGRPALDESRQSILIWAKPLMHKNQLEGLIDPCLKDNYKKDELERVVMTAALCVDASPLIRPQMSQAVILLRVKEDECVETTEKQPLKRTFSEELLDAKEYNSTKYLKELRRHRMVAFASNSDLTTLSPRSPLSPTLLL